METSPVSLRSIFACLSFTFLLCTSATIGFAQVNFTLKGTINKDFKSDTLIVENGSNPINIPISPTGSFYYKGTISEEDFFFIKTEHSNAWGIWISPGDIDLNLEEWKMDGLTNAEKNFLKIKSISGPSETEKYEWLGHKKTEIRKQYLNVSRSQQNDSLAKYFDPYVAEYIVGHHNSKFSVAIIKMYVVSKEHKRAYLELDTQSLPKEEFESLRAAMKTDSMRDIITMPGLTVKDFTINNNQGKSFSLNSLKSKYILIDFWASWCSPCMAQNPELKELYSKFHEKGFEIVAVSLDDSKEKWKKAVKDEKLPWIQVSDLKGKEGSLAKRFYINPIPFNLLIDSDRKIIARNFSPGELNTKLKELLDQ